MTTETMRDVMSEPVQIEGGAPREYEANQGRRARFPIGDTFYEAGYTIGLLKADSGVTRVELKQHGQDTELFGSDFDFAEEGRDEFERLKSQLIERGRVQFMIDLAERGEILPTEFLGAVRTGEPMALLVAADFQDERGESDKALLLRAAYHKLMNEHGVTVKNGKKSVILMNPSRDLSVVVITVGKSIRVISTKDTSEKQPSGRYATVRRMEVREFQVGEMAEYDSYNLSYYGPIKSITEKTVVIAERYGGKPKLHRLKIGQFVGKNYDFDLAQTQKRNSEYMD